MPKRSLAENQIRNPEQWEQLWNSHADVLKRPTKTPVQLHPPCRYASGFQSRMDREFEKAKTNGSPLAINQAKLILQDHFWSWYQQAPLSCRQHMTTAGHKCIFEVYHDCYDRIRELELDTVSLSTLTYIIPPPPPKPTLAGMLGIEEDG